MLQISLTKELPNKICNPCINKVQDVYIFHQTINQNELILQQKLSNKLCNEIKYGNSIKQENELSVNKSSISGEELENLETVVKSELTEASKYSTYYEDDNLYLNDLNNENSLNNIDSEEKRTSHKNLSNINTDDIPTNILTENKNLIIDTSAKIDELKRHMCLTCFEIFPNQRELLNHYRTIELERYNKNNIGNNDKTEPVQYKLYESEDGTLVYKCEKCDRKYVHKALIERHIKSHIEKRPFLCKLCGKICLLTFIT